MKIIFIFIFFVACSVKDLSLKKTKNQNSFKSGVSFLWNENSKTLKKPSLISVNELYLYEMGHNVNIIHREYLYPKSSGPYFFRIAGEPVKLYLSTDDNPKNKKLIAQSPHWSGEEQYAKYEKQTSKEIHLKAGKKYYLEITQSVKTPGKSDFYSVEWAKHNRNKYQIITKKYLQANYQPKKKSMGFFI